MPFNPHPKPEKPVFKCAWDGCAIKEEYGHTGYCPYHYSIRLRTRSKGEKLLDEAKAKQKPKSDLRKWTEAADKWFSIFVRLTGADEHGLCTCYTCGKTYAWRNIDCGHFQSRGLYATRWDTDNARPQCSHCNGFRGGQQLLFAQHLDNELGAGAAERIRIKAKNYFKKSIVVMKFLTDEFKEKAILLAKEKRLEL